MKVKTRKWISWNPSIPGSGSCKTTVEIRDDKLLTGITLNGHLTRKRAIQLAFEYLQGEGRWSSEFLQRLKRA